MKSIWIFINKNSSDQNIIKYQYDLTGIYMSMNLSVHIWTNQLMLEYIKILLQTYTEKIYITFHKLIGNLLKPSRNFWSYCDGERIDCKRGD